MKEFIKSKLNESMVYEIIESYIEEDYPSNFDLEKFSNLNSFKKRVDYCENYLKRISSGSGRIVYLVDDTKVLKLAKNAKGIAQNEIEIEYSNYHDISDITAKVFASNDNNLWVEMELAKKVTPAIFKQITGFNWNDFVGVMENHYYRVNPQKAPRWHQDTETTEIESKMWDDEFCYDMLSFMGNYDVPVGDLIKLNSYGVVNRNGSDAIVMVDYGLTNDVWQGYYS
jgi:hypothetical protein